MTTHDSRKSRRLSWLLRHGAREVGLAMDEAGWSRIDDVTETLGLSREALLQCVAGNDKQRLETAGDYIRAVQGHSLEGTPVTLEGLEASWECVEGRSAPLFHGTKRRIVRDIAASGGLAPMNRTHVHLADHPQSRVGKRAQVGVLLVIDPARLAEHGLRVFRAPNGVLLSRRVPWAAVVDIQAVSASARHNLESLVACLVSEPR